IRAQLWNAEYLPPALIFSIIYFRGLNTVNQHQQ
ncbi:unnamed protein product, partial [Allacma fusca]